jgi:uncharacterized membrane protein YuzA (DUF378 family)
MKGLDVITLILVIIGAIVWGLIGLFDWNLVAAIFDGGGEMSVISRIIYILVGLSGLWQLMPLFRSMGNS